MDAFVTPGESSWSSKMGGGGGGLFAVLKVENNPDGGVDCGFLVDDLESADVRGGVVGL